MKKTVYIFNHYSHTPENGTNTTHYMFAKYLQDAGYDVKIFTASAIHNTNINEITDNKTYIEKTIDGRDFVFINTRDYSGNGKQRMLNMIDYYKGLLKVTKNFKKPDIIYASSPHIFTLRAGLKVAKRFKVPCVCEVRDLWPEAIVEYSKYTASHPLIKMLYRMEKKIYKKADALIYTMAGSVDYITEKGWQNDIDLTKINWINNGIECEEHDKNLEKYPCDDEEMNDETTFKVVYTGSMRKANGIEDILEYAKAVAKKGYDNIKFILYGEGEQTDQLIKECAKQKIENISFKGFVPKYYLPAILNKADLCLGHYKEAKTSRFGTSNFKMFEYLASGKPILYTIKTKYSIVEEYGCGIELETRDPEKIADEIIKIYNMSEEQKKLWSENAKRAAHDFDIAVMAKKLEKVFDNTINNYKK